MNKPLDPARIVFAVIIVFPIIAILMTIHIITEKFLNLLTSAIESLKLIYVLLLGDSK